MEKTINIIFSEIHPSLTKKLNQLNEIILEKYINKTMVKKG